MRKAHGEPSAPSTRFAKVAMPFWPFRSRPNRTEPAVPEGMRIYAIGDVHGRLDLLTELLRQIEEDNLARPSAQLHIVMLGDLIDRGPDSAGVIDLLLNRPRDFATFHFIAGNHEEAMIQSLEEGADPHKVEWLRYGGREALRSYGVPDDVFEMRGSLLSDELRRYVPQAHVDFVQTFEDSLVLGDYLFVHAGIRPGKPLAKQARKDLLWIREPFLSDDKTDHGHMVVHGHTITRDPELRPNRIGIDTGAYATGVLTALALEGTERRILQARGDRG